MTNVIWQPHDGSQTLFLTCPVFECLYEGTRGPGKTDALLMDFAQHVGQFGEAWRGILFREEYKELADVVSKSKKWFRQIFPAARFLESKSDYKWVWPTGEELLFRAGKKEDDYWNYHGHEYPWIGFEELTKWSSPAFYLAMHSTCRSSSPGMPRKIRATCNPYGKGHNWVKARFVNPSPIPGQIIRDGRRDRVRIHGTIWENPVLLENDPDYLHTLLDIGEPNRRKAWLDGSWDITSGGMFDDLWDSRMHVLPRFKIPASWRTDRSFDWGSAKPFSVGWWAESDGTPAIIDGKQRTFARGSVFRIFEWYGYNGERNVGLKIVDSEIAKGINEREQSLIANGWVARKPRPGPADSSIFDEKNGDSTARQMEKHGIRWEKADKSPGSRIRGWEVMRRMLKASVEYPKEEPSLYVFENCTQFIETVPTIPRDEKDPDDVDTDAEDHIADEVRYRVTAPKRTMTTETLRGT